MARDKYNREVEEMYNQYGLLSNQEQQDYGRYQDDYNKWAAERDYAAGRYDSERDYDYGKYVDDRNFGYQVHTDEQDRAFNEYLAEVNRVQFNAQHEEDIRQYNENMAFNKEQADIGNKQWQQSFDADKEQRRIDNEYRDQVYADTLTQQERDNEYRETVRQDGIDSENRAYAREDVLATIAAGGTPDSKMLKTAGWTKATAQAHAAIASGNGDSDEIIDLVKAMPTDEIVDLLETYSAKGNNNAIDVLVDDWYLTGRITEEQRDEYRKKYLKGNSHVINDTTVATPTGDRGGTNLQRAW